MFPDVRRKSAEDLSDFVEEARDLRSRSTCLLLGLDMQWHGLNVQVERRFGSGISQVALFLVLGAPMDTSFAPEMQEVEKSQSG